MFEFIFSDKKGSRIGTPHWMAPEIMRGEKYDEFSDVYSYGMVVWYVNFYLYLYMHIGPQNYKKIKFIIPKLKKKK